MKFLQFYKNGHPVLGVVTDHGVLDLSAHPDLPQTMLELCRRGVLSSFEVPDGPYLEQSKLTLAPVVTGM